MASTTRTRVAPAAVSSVDQILFLQRTVGNQAVGTLLAGNLPAPPERIQRQAVTTVAFKFGPIKEHLKTKSPELHKLIASNPFTGPFTNAYSETIDGKTHIWQISVEFTSTKLGLGKRAATFPVKSDPGKPHVHKIQILINTFAFDDPELNKQFPDPVKREEARHAETLTHELIHASVLMQQQGALRTDEAGLVVGYRKMLDTAKSGAAEKERLAALSGISLILLYLELLEDDEAARDRFIDRQLDVLVEEKYAYQTARASFGRTIDNETIAKIYVDDVVRTQQRKAKQKEMSHEVNLARVNLIDAVKKFYDKIDSELAASAQPVKEAPRQEERNPFERRRGLHPPEP